MDDIYHEKKICENCYFSWTQVTEWFYIGRMADFPIQAQRGRSIIYSIVFKFLQCYHKCLFNSFPRYWMIIRCLKGQSHEIFLSGFFLSLISTWDPESILAFHRYSYPVPRTPGSRDSLVVHRTPGSQFKIWISTWIIIKIRNRPRTSLLGPVGAVWQKNRLNNPVKMSL